MNGTMSVRVRDLPSRAEIYVDNVLRRIVRAERLGTVEAFGQSFDGMTRLHFADGTTLLASLYDIVEMVPGKTCKYCGDPATMRCPRCEQRYCDYCGRAGYHTPCESPADGTSGNCGECDEDDVELCGECQLCGDCCECDDSEASYSYPNCAYCDHAYREREKTWRECKGKHYCDKDRNCMKRPAYWCPVHGKAECATHACPAVRSHHSLSRGSDSSGPVISTARECDSCGRYVRSIWCERHSRYECEYCNDHPGVACPWCREHKRARYCSSHGRWECRTCDQGLPTSGAVRNSSRY